jgi:Zn-dependent membrane protease YugP
MFFFDPMLLLWTLPAVALGLLAQLWISSAYSRGLRLPASMTGAMAARRILDAAGLERVEIEQVHGHLSDHYDPRAKVLRLSGDVYHGRSLASVGIAAHEAGHAIQDAVGYIPLVVRNLAVPAASIGSNGGILLLALGAAFNFKPLFFIGLLLFSAVVVFQLINLPVEFNASSRAKALLVDLGIVHGQDMGPVKSVLWAAALTYVAATLQSVLTLLYYASRLSGGRSSDE